MGLSEHRKRIGLSQQQLAEELNLTSKAYISQLETGAVPFPIKLALEVEKWSGGEVRAVDLLEPEDRELLRLAIEREAATLAPALAEV